MAGHVDIVFDGPPGPVSGRFVKVENAKGQSIKFGERIKREDGRWVACLRLDDKIRWCYEHIAPVGARAEMLRIRNEPVSGLLVGQLYHYVDDFDLDGSVDVGSTTRLEGQPHAPVGTVSQFFHRGTNRGDQFRAEYQKVY